MDRRLVAEAAVAVDDDDALGSNEPGALGGEEAHGAGDVAGSSHPPGGHRGAIGLLNVVGDVGVALDRDEAGRDRVRGDAGRASSRAQLRVRPICAYKMAPARPETMLARTCQPVASQARRRESCEDDRVAGRDELGIFDRL